MCLHLWGKCSWLSVRSAGKFKGWEPLETGLGVPVMRWPEKKGPFWKRPTNGHPLARSGTGPGHSACLRSNSWWDGSVILEVDFNSTQISLSGCSRPSDSCSPPHAVLPCPELCQPAQELLESRSRCGLSLPVGFPHLSPSVTYTRALRNPDQATEQQLIKTTQEFQRKAELGPSAKDISG